MLNRLLDCPKKEQLYRQIPRAEQVPQGSFILGKSMHKGIEHAEMGVDGLDPYDLDAAQDGGRFARHLVALYREGIKEAGGPDVVRFGGRKTKEWDAGEDMRWAEHWLPIFGRRFVGLRRRDRESGLELLNQPGSAKPIGSEMRVATVLPDGTTVVGYIDAFMLGVVDTDTGEVTYTIRDYKTGSWNGIDYLQPVTYAWLVRTMLDLQADWAEVVKFRTNDPVKRVKRFRITPFMGMIEEQYRTLAFVAEMAYEHNLWMVNPSAWHDSCPVREHCDFYRSLQEAKASAPSDG